MRYIGKNRHTSQHDGKIQCIGPDAFTASFECPYIGCSQIFVFKKELKMHWDKCHKGPEIKCSICAKTFSKIEYLKKHLKTHGNIFE